MKHMRKRFFSLFLSFLLAYSSVIPAFAAEGTATTMQLVKTEGTVAISTSTGKDVPIIDNMKLYSGYEVETGAKSYAWVNLDNTKLAKLDAASRVSVRKRGKKLEILVDSGNIFFNITEPLKDDESLNIRTATMSAGIRGTSGWVEVTDNNNVRVSVLEGTVEVSVTDPATGQAKTDAVSSGETAVCVVYEPGREGDKCDILRESYDKETINGFVLQEVVSDVSLAEKIVEKGGLDLRDVTIEEVQTRIVVDEQKVEQKLEETAAAVETQEVRTVSEQTVWTAPQPEPAPQPSPTPPASNDTNTGNDTPAPVPQKPKTYTVTFDANGGTIAPEKTTVQVQKDKTVSAPSGVTRDGYELTGWYTDEACTTEYNFSTAVTGTLKLYAGWMRIYTVTFNANGGPTTPDVQKVANGGRATEPSLLMRFGHIFKGWSVNEACEDSDAKCTDRYDFNAAITGNITLYAHWGVAPNEGKTGALTWQYDSSTHIMTMSGTGKMDDYNYDSKYEIKRSPWEGYWDEMTGLTIESGVTVIGDYAFFYCTALGRDIVIPEGVASIGRYAFAECSKMTSISIPGSVTSIGDFAFAECSELRDIEFGGTSEQWKSVIAKSPNVLKGANKYVLKTSDPNSAAEPASLNMTEEYAVEDEANSDTPALETTKEDSEADEKFEADVPKEPVEEPSEESEPNTENEEKPVTEIGEPPVADIPEDPVEQPVEEPSGESGSDEAAESETTDSGTDGSETAESETEVTE